MSCSSAVCMVVETEFEIMNAVHNLLVFFVVVIVVIIIVVVVVVVVDSIVVHDLLLIFKHSLLKNRY